MKNNINYDQPDLVISEADSQSYGNLYHDVPEQVKYKNPVNYSNETNTVVKENVKNINDFLINYGISIEDKDKCIREGVSFTQKDILKHDLVVIVKNGLKFDLNDLKEIISGIVDNTTLTKAEIETIIINEVTKSIPPDTGDVVARIVSLEGKALELKSEIDELSTHATVVDGIILSINGRISDIVGTQSSQYGIISNIDTRLSSAENIIHNNSSEILSILSQITNIKNDVLNNTTSISNIELDIDDIFNRLYSLESLVSVATSDIVGINSRLLAIDSSIINISSDILATSNRLTTDESNISSHSNQISTINNSISLLVGDVSAIESRLDADESNISSNNANIASINTTIDSINLSIGSINALLITRYNEIQSIFLSIQDINNTLSTIINDTSLSSRVSAIESQMSTGMSRLLALETTASQEKIKTDSNTSNINTINSEISTIGVSLDSINARIDALNPDTGDIATRLHTIETNYANILSDMNDVKADIVTIQNEELDEEAILTNNIKILNYKFYQMIEVGEIVYVIKKHSNNMCIIKRVDDNGGYFDIRYSNIFDIGELPTKLSNLEAVGYNDLSLINM